MKAEGKTWNYHDILAQFITMHNKKSNVLLIWSGDWPTYSSNSDKYYVILAGEGFDSTDEAWNWCQMPTITVRTTAAYRFAVTSGM